MAVGTETDGSIPFDDEFTVLLYEFKVQIAEYLATLRHTDMRTLADLMQFNIDHCAEEMPWYGQEIFELAEATTLIRLGYAIEQTIDARVPPTLAGVVPPLPDPSGLCDPTIAASSAMPTMSPADHAAMHGRHPRHW